MASSSRASPSGSGDHLTLPSHGSGLIELMSVATRRGLLVLTLALLLGLLADWLLRATPLGLGATLWTLVTLALIALLARRTGRLRGPLAVGLAVAPLFVLCLS